MVVLDTSVILKWFRPEEGSDRAKVYRDAHLNRTETIYCPDLVIYELANVAVVNPDIPDSEVLEIIETFWETNILLVAPDKDLSLLTTGLAEQYDISVYDASYLALAVTLSCDLITADAKLFYKVELPFVKLL
jgi:predicted nucleic acid-binding protein